MNTASDLLALLPGDHAKVPLPDAQMVPAAGYTAILGATAGRVRILPQSRHQALSSAAARMAILESAMPLGTVLPVQPGTVMSPADVARCVIANRPLLDDLTNQLAGQVQFQVTVRWCADKVLSHFRDSPELRQIFAAGRSDAQTLQKAVGALANRLSQDIAAQICAPATDSLRLPPAEDHLVNIVLRLPHDAQQALDQALEAVDAIWPEGLHIRQIGPAPAASFASLSMTTISQQDIAAAHAQLGLGSCASESAIRTARAERLRQAPHLAHQITTAATLVLAFARIGEAPFHYCQVQSDGQSRADPVWEGAA